MTSSSGQVVGSYAYTPFGEISNNDTTDFQFAGYYFHNRSQFSITRARFYSSKLGKWMSRDPIDDDANAYLYVNNNPISNTDYSGLKIDGSSGQQFKEGAKAMQAMCSCCLKGSDKVSACKTEASKIGTALEEAWKNNFGKTKGVASGGKMCYEWTEIFGNTLRGLNLQVWGHQQQLSFAKPNQNTTPGKLPVHAAQNIYMKDNPICEVWADDGFCDGNNVFHLQAPWPPGYVRP